MLKFVTQKNRGPGILNIIEVPESEISAAEKAIVEIMEVSVDDSLKVDLRVDVSAGVSSLSKAEMN